MADHPGTASPGRPPRGATHLEALAEAGSTLSPPRCSREPATGSNRSGPTRSVHAVLAAVADGDPEAPVEPARGRPLGGPAPGGERDAGRDVEQHVDLSPLHVLREAAGDAGVEGGPVDLAVEVQR